MNRTLVAAPPSVDSALPPIAAPATPPTPAPIAVSRWRLDIESQAERLATVATSSVHIPIRRIEFMIVVLAVVNRGRATGRRPRMNPIYAPSSDAAVSTC
jgi:hypothetical protein